MTDTELAAGRRITETAERLLGKLEQAVKELDAVTVLHREKARTESGETLTEYTVKYPRKKGMVDRGGLKQLTGVLKDLQDILLRDPELDLREREAKLLRLERELEQQGQAEGITVVLEGEAQDYAG